MDKDSWRRLHRLYFADYDKEDSKKKDVLDISYINKKMLDTIEELIEEGASPMQIAGCSQALAVQLYNQYLSTEEFVELITLVMQDTLGAEVESEISSTPFKERTLH